MTTTQHAGWWHPLMPVRLVRAAVVGQCGALDRLVRACRAIAAIRRAAADYGTAQTLDQIAERLTGLHERTARPGGM